MADRTCAIDGCDQPSRCRGWCTRHYGRWKMTGDPLQTPSGRTQRPAGLCEVTGCDRPRRKRNWCEMHYSRWQRNGSAADADQAWTVSDVEGCIVCGDPVPSGIGFRRYCSRSCASMAQRGIRARTRVCALCGNEFSLLTRSPRSGRRKYSSASTCARCGKPGNLRRNVPILVDRDGRDCGICGQGVDLDLRHPDPRSPSVDHVVPRSLGGHDHISNYQLTHLLCNIRKQNRLTEAGVISTS